MDQPIIELLTDMQNDSAGNYLNDKQVLEAAHAAGLTEGSVREIAGFYGMLHTAVQPRYLIEVCKSNPCMLCGNEWIAETLKEELDIDMGETTPDGCFGTAYMNCCGHCGAGPVIRVGNTVYENMTKERLSGLIDEFRHSKGGE